MTGDDGFVIAVFGRPVRLEAHETPESRRLALDMLRAISRDTDDRKDEWRP